MPTGKTVKIGVWENDKFIGVVIYSYGANNNAAKYFSLKQEQVCELTRIALKSHITPVTKILSISLKMLKKSNPGLQMVFSYSDKTNQNHHGGIYQGDNWAYIGERSTSSKGAYYFIRGKKIHGRSARAKYGKDINFPKPWSHAPSETKHLYVKILNPCYILKYKIHEYPKRATSKDNVASAIHAEEGGAIPTVALQSLESIL